MIKSAKDGEEEAESSHSSNFFTTWEIFPIYRAWFTNLILILGIKSLIPYQRLIFREIRGLETRKSTDKYIFFFFSAFMYSSITNYSYTIGWSAGGVEILRHTTLELVYGKTLGL